MSIDDVNTPQLVERALNYAKAKGDGKPEWFYAFPYGPDRIIDRGNGWYQIGHIQRDYWQESFPVLYNPTTRQLRVKVPRLTRK